MKMVKNNQNEEILEQDELVSNSEIYERQFYYLATLKNYLESQLEQVELQFERLKNEQETNDQKQE